MKKDRLELLINENEIPVKRYYYFIDKSELLKKICSYILDSHFTGSLFSEEIDMGITPYALTLDEYDVALEFLNGDNVFYDLGDRQDVYYKNMNLTLPYEELSRIDKILSREIFLYMKNNNILVL